MFTFIVNIFGDTMLPCRTPSSCVLSNLTLHVLLLKTKVSWNPLKEYDRTHGGCIYAWMVVVDLLIIYHAMQQT